MNRVFLVFTLLVLLVFGVQARAANTDLAGHYVYVPERSASVDQAVEKTVAEVNFVLRPIARSRLNKTNQPYQNITLGVSGGKASITTDKRAPIVAPVDGKPIKWKREDGEIMDLSMQWQGKGLQETIAADDGKRVNLFELSPDGNELRMLVTVSSKRLPKPLVYTLVYQRQ
ncbi:MAG: hypothetical protein REI12_02005 [Pedobacter sp.]|nr:hypothetical protein [Pedobacter sp.]